MPHVHVPHTQLRRPLARRVSYLGDVCRAGARPLERCRPPLSQRSWGTLASHATRRAELYVIRQRAGRAGASSAHGGGGGSAASGGSCFAGAL